MNEDLHPLRDTELDWAVDRLADRRDVLRPCAPVYWAPAEDARERHLAFLTRAVLDAGALAFRTPDSVLIAVPSRGEWIVDDAAVDDWDGDGEALWGELVANARGEKVRFVCPAPEEDRLAFALRHGLRVVESWWHLEVPIVNEATTMAATQVGTQRARIEVAPPVYNPGGPILFLTDPDAETLAAAPDAAVELGCPLVVVAQTDEAVATALADAGYVHHVDFAEGVLA